MKTDLEYLNYILSLLDKNPKYTIHIKIDNILQFEEFFKDWTSLYLSELDNEIMIDLSKINHYFTIYCYFFYLNNKELFKRENTNYRKLHYIRPMVDYTNKTLESFKGLRYQGVLLVSDYINEDIISKAKYYIRRIKLKELINEN